MSDRKGQRQPGGAGAATTEDLIALAGREQISAPVPVVQETTTKDDMAQFATPGYALRPTTLAGAEEIERRAREQDFDWERSDSIFVWEQPRSAVYRTQRDQVAIRQDQPEDPCLIFNIGSLPDLIRALARQIDGDHTGRVWESINEALIGYDL